MEKPYNILSDMCNLWGKMMFNEMDSVYINQE